MRTAPVLQRYFASVFLIEVEVADGDFVEDFMFPDWAAMRFNREPTVTGNTRGGANVGQSAFSVSGPRSQEACIRTGNLRQWGVLVHPLGWALLVGKPAHEYANGLADGMTDPVFARFRPLAETLFGPEPDTDGELQRLTAFFAGLEPLHEPAEASIARVYDAVQDPEIDSVPQLADRAGISRRTLERLCQRTFGFPPKMLLRRQRFLRSLIDFTVDPSLKWVGALDATYHDQAQFVRDFREFMGMTPSEYGQREKPVVEPVVHARVRYLRETMQGFDKAARLAGA
ncbi:AraC family transcriptional regulator [Novosphingobium mangrovi (ex Huang et al. 2023)]|uniref:Helix-turn-helix domain-containing protein n=1 Tax=Novosphingobium mangrovi (ex Huang et al. 2023) TaxID=2976432 RepID=A0ABT2I2Z2_9SPHN|nr:helix-turn-helix domain-containing protein [Novosphingobium mangrovi (ex Huang et al. 2023)]MCT2399176.1 helix-turn-helix domain-containing protein [Novosphingobium mangrovi (ex Huang et al. 2023)]